jgi:tetratricopeptide (TPR) repeat protein
MALAALGRTDECARVVEDGLVEAGGSLNFTGEMILRAAEELLAHGSEFAGLAMAQRALDWFTGMDFSERALPRAQRNSAVAPSLLGQHETALRTLSALAADQPESCSLLGEVGIEAAWLGDRETATEISQRLLAVDEPFTLGGPSYVRAAIATRLGDHAEGIRLLRQAAAEGFWDWERLHRDMDFEPLRDDPEFQEILRPKG